MKKMLLLSASETLKSPLIFSSNLQSKPKLFRSSLALLQSNTNFQKPIVYASSPSTSIHLQPKKNTPESLLNWGDFAARVSGEWEGFGAEFSPEGNPIDLPEFVVPDAFREWEVEVFDWQIQCPTLASETPEPRFFYKLIKLLPTVGCEADAATRHSVDERRVAGGSENGGLVLGFHPSGRYVCVWPADGMLEVEHCLVNPKNWEERVRVIQVVGIDEGMLRLEKIWIFSEQRDGDFRNGEQLGGCVVRQSGFALTKVVEASEIVGEWEGGERFSVGGFAVDQKFPIQQLVKDETQKSIRDQIGLIVLPKNLWCSLKVMESGETCAEVGWLVDCGHALTSKCVLHNDGRLKEMIIDWASRTLNDKEI